MRCLNGWIRLLGLVLLPLVSACATTRTIDVSTNPPDATISLDGVPMGQGPLVEKVKFHGRDDVHELTATRDGYRDGSYTLTRDDPTTAVEIDLKPESKRVTFTVTPAAAIIAIDGVPLGSQPIVAVSRDLPFIKDERGNWTYHTVTASRDGFMPAKVVVNWTDPTTDYTLQLQPMRKKVSITTTPPGATVWLDGQSVGVSPVTIDNVAFAFDVDDNQYVPHKVRLTKPGYDAIDTNISWDDGKTDYTIEVPAKHKMVRFLTDPANAMVSIDGKPAAIGEAGVPQAELTYTPTDANGDLPVYTATITKHTAETEWYPTTMPIAWDDGKSEYTVRLKEVKTRPVKMLQIVPTRDDDGVWEMLPRETTTLGMKDISEGPGKDPPAMLYQAPKGVTIGSISVSPSGSQVLFTLLTGTDKASLRSQVMAIGSDGSGGVQEITNGQALDIMPSFTPDGTQIVFASNRAGRRMNIWRRNVTGGTGYEQLTNFDEQDLWPMIDAAPKARLFYEALSDSQADPQLYEGPADGGPRVDLTTIPVSQPRISPRADTIIFTSPNQRTGNREIYSVPDHGGPPVNITNDPDTDCYDPAWSRDGNQIAYVCDRGMDEDRRRNPDIWIIDLSHPDHSTQVTTNGSIDDCPAWDPSGNAIYFRSNRGGLWGIWKISIK